MMRLKLRRSTMRVLSACALVAAGALAATLLTGRSRRAGAAKPVPLSSVRVRRTDLVVRDRFRGRLVYPPRNSIHLEGDGIVTSLPQAGDSVARDSAIATVDDQPIGVLYGEQPLYRTLGDEPTQGPELAVDQAHAAVLAAELALRQTADDRGEASVARRAQLRVNLIQARYRLDSARAALKRAQTPERGRDVATVAENLSVRGDDGEPTDVWSSALRGAVESWQRHLGANPTGAVNPDDVVVVPGPVRVVAVTGRTGEPASQVSISLSARAPEAIFRLRGAAPGSLHRGRRVTITTDDRSSVCAIVAVHHSAGTATVIAALPPHSPLRMGSGGRVQMTIVASIHRNVLTAPVQALLALAGGGYALQRRDGRLIPVRIGITHDQQVEVFGADIHAGLRVVSVA